MPNLSRYIDYRLFLRDYYQERRKKEPGFSFQDFSRFAGIKSKGFLHNVIAGKRTLNCVHTAGLCKAMRFGAFEARFFTLLVNFNQAHDHASRAELFEKLSTIKRRGKQAWPCQIVRNDQFEYYSQFHHSVVRSLIGIHGFGGDFKKLASQVYPRISPRKARLSVDLLIRLGLVKKEKNRWVVCDRLISTPPEVQSLAIVNHHKQSLALAQKALTDLPRDLRNISSATLGISNETYLELCREVEALRFRLLERAGADTHADRVYQFNFQLFPVSRQRSPSGRKTK
jgi:uncharacterized protein (TIGR02147 family)